MTEPVYTEMDHRLSVVKRWGTLHTLQTQSVAEHCFNVERITMRIAIGWFGIKDPRALFMLSQYALHHDDSEALGGDLNTMIKPYFDEKTFEKEHADVLPAPIPISDEYRKIVKLADKLEGYHFLCVETALGNRYAENHMKAEFNIVMEWAQSNLGPDVFVHISNSLGATMDEMQRERSIRHTRRGR